MEGSLHIIIGCMFSGKTTELICVDKKYSSVGKKVLSINYEKDIRYGSDSYMYSHNLNKTQCIMVMKLEDVPLSLVESSNIILINEAQFFKDLVFYCKLWCDTMKKNITVSGLDGDFERKPFGHILELIPFCNSVRKLSAFCVLCDKNSLPKEAIFTHRVTNEKEQELIGSDNYIALCRYHYLKENNLNN